MAIRDIFITSIHCPSCGSNVKDFELYHVGIGEQYKIGDEILPENTIRDFKPEPKCIHNGIATCKSCNESVIIGLYMEDCTIKNIQEILLIKSGYGEIPESFQIKRNGESIF